LSCSLDERAAARHLQELRHRFGDGQILERFERLVLLAAVVHRGRGHVLRGCGQLADLLADHREVPLAARDGELLHGEGDTGCDVRVVAVDHQGEEETAPFTHLVQTVDRHGVHVVPVVPARRHLVQPPQLVVHGEVPVVADGLRRHELDHQEPAVLAERVDHGLGHHDVAVVVNARVDLEEPRAVRVR